MDDRQVTEIADALRELASTGPSPAEFLTLLAPGVALIAAGVAAVVGWRNLRQQQKALEETVASDAKNLKQRQEADARSEWWRRTQWALEATSSTDARMSDYGTGILELLVNSELAGPKDKELLDAVWQDTSTRLRDENIKQLIGDAGPYKDGPSPRES